MKRSKEGPLPRPPRPGPGGERARAAGPADVPAVVDLALEALAEAGAAPRREVVEWVAQAVVHDPLRGFYFLADGPSEDGGAVGLAAIEAAAVAEHGWTGRLSCLYVRPQHRRRGTGAWLLEEALERARYQGLNHLVCDLADGGEVARRLLERAGFEPLPMTSYRVELRPLYDDE